MTLADATRAAQQAGFTGVHLVEAVAVAQAESGGVIGSTNHNANGSVDHGLWQINSAAWPQYDAARLVSDPVYNAKAAFDISKGGTDWSPWTSTHNGTAQQAVPTAEKSIDALISTGNASYIKTLGAPAGFNGTTNADWTIWLADPFGSLARQAAGLGNSGGVAPLLDPLTGVAGNIAGSIFPKPIVQFFTNLTSGKFWLRVGELIGAILLIEIGLSLVFRKQLFAIAAGRVTLPVKAATEAVK